MSRLRTVVKNLLMFENQMQTLTDELEKLHPGLKARIYEDAKAYKETDLEAHADAMMLQIQQLDNSETP